MPLRATTPPFSTPRPLVKPEGTGDSNPGAAATPSHPQASIELMHDLFARHDHSTAPAGPLSGTTALPQSAGFQSTAQPMRQKSNATRNSTGSMIPFAFLLGNNPEASTSGLPFSVPRPPKGSFAGTVLDPMPRNVGAEEAQAVDQAGTGKIADAKSKTGGTADGAGVADSDVTVGPEGGVTEVQRAAAMAAEEDLQAAEEFAAEAVQSPKVRSLPATAGCSPCKAVC